MGNFSETQDLMKLLDRLAELQQAPLMTVTVKSGQNPKSKTLPVPEVEALHKIYADGRWTTSLKSLKIAAQEL